MSTLGTLLKESDPLRHEPPLGTREAQSMRRTMLDAVRPPPAALWPRALPVAALVVLMVVAGAAAGRRLKAPEPMPAGGPLNAGVDSAGRRQVQFATPGGTRIIWTIDPEFQLGVMP